MAVGKVKWYQIIVGGLLIMNLPISYVALKFGAKPEMTIHIAIIISFVSLLIRLFLLYRYVSFPVKEFLTKVLGTAAIVVLLSYVLSNSVYNLMSIHGFIQLILTVCVSWMISGVVILFIGMNKSERFMIKNAAIKVLNKLGIK